MKFLEFKNEEKIKVSDIPILNIEELREETLNMNKRPVGFFGQKTDDSVRLFVVLAADDEGKLFVSSSIFEKNQKSYESFTSKNLAFHIFEREFYENFEIEPLNHPWLKPVRNFDKEYKFFEMEGEEIHQVAVGPIHAGIIEPGHFRFMCNGEYVYNLEIQLGYQKKGVEKLITKRKINNRLAESVCGDSVIAHNTAYSKVLEKLMGITVSKKSEIIRAIALETERMAIHTGDMGAIAGDIAYLMGSAVFGVTRTLVINTLMEISGSRFGRGLIDVGGVNFNITDSQIEKMKTTFKKVEKDVVRMTKTMLNSPSVISRLEKTGILSKEQALEINVVGMAAKASGINHDTRFDFKTCDLYDNIEKIKMKNLSGDVYSRFMVRYREVRQSVKIIFSLLDLLPKYSNDELLCKTDNNLSADSFVVSMVEGWRGEVVHIAITDNIGFLNTYKIKDPSFNNWYGLALAVRNNGISDFPLCNKSFNLSYCGNDL